MNEICVIIVCKLFLPYTNWVSQFNLKILDDIMEINDILYDHGETTSLRL